LYMPGMAGNLQFVLESNGKFKKLIDAAHIETRYRSGSMLYQIQDPLIGSGQIRITVLAQAEEEGMIVKLEANGMSGDAKIHTVFGGASGRKFRRGGDIGADPESGFYLLPEYAVNNRYQLAGNNFELTYLDGKGNPEFVYVTFSGTEQMRLSEGKVLDDSTKLTETGAQGSPIVYNTYRLGSQPV